MRLSRFFLPILKENPKEAEIVSHRLMLRAGMIRQEAAGIYALLPLGFGGFKKIQPVARGAQNGAGGAGLFVPTPQPQGPLRDNGRHEAYRPAKHRSTDSLH